jgi:hypothetical protein
MPTILFKGWKVAMRGIPFILLLREKTDISLKRAKEIKERIVDDEIVTFEVPTYQEANEVVTGARVLGVICEVR